MSEDKDMLPDAEFGVICSDCRTLQNTERVMRSAWYQQGLTPPCQFCGGVTHEIALAEVPQFIEDSKKGKRIL